MLADNHLHMSIEIHVLICMCRFVRGEAIIGGFALYPIASDPMKCRVAYLTWVDPKVQNNFIVI